MTKISICVGSACHLKGAHGVLHAFKNLIDKYQINASVDVAGNFCCGKCTEGVVVKINDVLITQVSKDKVYDIFNEMILQSSIAND